MISIAPVIVLSVATRVQARRVELATQAAKSYVDGVRTGAIVTPNSVVVLSPTDPLALQKVSQVAAPDPTLNLATICQPPALNTTNFYCQNPPRLLPSTTQASLYCINLNGDEKGCAKKSSKAFVVQAFRSIAPVSALTPNLPKISDDGSGGYLLAVRVYRADGFDGTPFNTSQALDGKKVRTYAGGRGDLKSPLVETTTEIRGSGTSWQSLCTRLGGCK